MDYHLSIKRNEVLTQHASKQRLGRSSVTCHTGRVTFDTDGKQSAGHVGLPALQTKAQRSLALLLCQLC